MRETLRQIGSAIRNASTYPPIRNHAAAVASLAPPKNFLAQLRNIYADFIHRWRYVKDPTSRELVTASPEAIWRLTMGGDGVGVGYGKGAGDCDCATVALGSMLEAIGFRTRLGTTAGVKAPPGRLFSHVFIQAHVPKIGWITLDPVLHPKRSFGETAYHSRIAWWDLDGNPLGYKGNYGLGGSEVSDMAMPRNENIEYWQDYGMGAVTDEATEEPVEWSTYGLSGWGWMDSPAGKVSSVAQYGIIDGLSLNGLAAEVDENDAWNSVAGTYRTPMLQTTSLEDFQYLKNNGIPYDGMIALGDTGEPYVYDGLSGWFKKIFKKVKKGVRKVAKKIKGGIKKLLKKTKIGRWLIRVGGKIKKIAMKVVRPLIKYVGKYAAKLAPIAAIIPGYGTAIAAALMAAGKVAQLMQKYGVFTAGKKGKVRTLGFKKPKKSKKFFKSMHLAAKSMKKYSKRNPRDFKKLATKLGKKHPLKAGIPKASYSTLLPMLKEYKKRHPGNFAKLLKEVR